MAQYTCMVTILTATFNRGNLLNRLYKSLCRQSKKGFQWIVIDDGSTDSTENIVHSFKNDEFKIEYYKKTNGGKHTALNFSHPFIRGELVLIVDSDDYLTTDAIETIENDWNKYCNDKLIGGLSYLRMGENGKFLSHRPPSDYYINDEIHYRENNNIGGDQCEVTRSEIIKTFPFPVFSAERFMSEGWLWRHIASHYRTVYRSKPIYICEYLEGGLTKSGRKFRMNNPIGMMENCKSFFISGISTKVKVKEALLYDVYAICSNRNVVSLIKKSSNFFLCSVMLPLGLILYCYWKYK